MTIHVPDFDDIGASAIAVEQFYPLDQIMVDLHQYGLMIQGATHDQVLAIIADSIMMVPPEEDMDTIHGMAFMAIVMDTAWARGHMPYILPPLAIVDDLPRLVLHSEGGVRILIGEDPDPWDPIVFHVRFGSVTS